MELSKNELAKEEKRLADTIKVIKDNIFELCNGIIQKDYKKI